MARRKFGRKGRGRFGRARSFIRKTVSTMGPIEAKRIILDKLSIPSDAGGDWNVLLTVPLIICQETVDEEIESNGTTVAQVPLYSKIVGIKANLTVHGLAANTNVRWMLVKDPDSEANVTSLTDGFFHSSNDTQQIRELRANTLAKGIIYGTDKTSGRINIFVRRKTLHRLGSLRENDRWLLLLAQDTTSICSLSGFGTIYVRMN